MKPLVLISIATTLLLSSCNLKEGMSPILIAAHDGEYKEVARLIEAGKNVNKKSRYGWTPLVFAASEGHTEIVELLLANGAEANLETKEIPPAFMASSGGYNPTTALAESIKNKHLDIAYLLIGKGTKIDSLSIAHAGRIGNIELLSLMLEKGADLNQYSGDSLTPSALTVSAKKGKLDVVKWLHEQGAQLNILLGRSLPLKSAVESKNPAVVSYLLNHGADPTLTIRDNGYFHDTILGTATNLSPDTQQESDHILQIINLLIEHGADVSKKNYVGETILDIELTRQANKEKRLAQNGPRSVHPNKVEKVKIQDAHYLKLIELLQNAMP